MIELGTGQLSWHAHERRSDRYGTIALWDDATPGGDGKHLPWPDEANAMQGQSGYLVAYVIETRKSDHVGDLFHKIFPEEPEVDEVVELGPGVLFFEEIDGGMYVGLKPAGSRTEFWLEPIDLYRLHQQTVRLCFAREDDK